MTSAVSEKWVRYLLGEDGDEPWPKDLSSSEDADFAELIGTLARQLHPLTPQNHVRNRLLDSLSSPSHRYAPFTTNLSLLFELQEEFASKLLKEICEESRWQPSPWPGVKVIPAASAALGGAELGFAMIPAGGGFPHHRHIGDEAYLVLQGTCKEEDGTLTSPGRITHRPAGTAHSFTVLGSKDLIMAFIHRGLDFDK